MTRLLPPLIALAILALWALAVHEVTTSSSMPEPAMGKRQGIEAGFARGDTPKSRAVPIPHRLVPSPRATRHHTRTQLLDVTAYCPTGNRTASGVWPRQGMAAGNRWRFGTRLSVPGFGTVTVQDRIGWGSDLDLFMDSCAAARRWGRQHLHVSVVR